MIPTNEAILFWHAVNVIKYNWSQSPFYKQNSTIVEKAHERMRKNGIVVVRNRIQTIMYLSGENGWDFVLHSDGFRRDSNGYAHIPDVFLSNCGKLDEAAATYRKKR